GPRGAKARPPSRPSGDGKQQEAAENEGSAGPGFGPPADRAKITARRYHFALVTLLRHAPPRVAKQGKGRVNPGAPTLLVAEEPRASQGRFRVAACRSELLTFFLRAAAVDHPPAVTARPTHG